MWSKTPPCADCPRQGCGAFHDECEEYKEWQANKPKQEINIADHYKFESIERRVSRYNYKHDRRRKR